MRANEFILSEKRRRHNKSRGFYGAGWFGYPAVDSNDLGGGDGGGVAETQGDIENNLPSIELARNNIAKILQAAQRIYDNWDESDSDTYAGGGICHLIADAICDVMGEIGVDCTPVSCSYEQHVYVAVRVAEGVYTIDIPYSIYETGGGFSWQKLPDVKFDSRDVVFYRTSGDPDEFENYTSLEEAFDHASGATSQQSFKQGVAEGVMSDLDQDRQDVNFESIVGYVINGLKKNIDIGRMELNLYQWGSKQLVDVDQELQDRGFRNLADLVDHIEQHNGKYVPPTDFGLGNLDKGVAEGQKTSRDQPVDPEGVIYLNDRTAIVGQKHGQPLRLKPEDAKKVKELADKYGAWYEGNGMDKAGTEKILDSYQGSWDDDLFAAKIKGYPYQFLYVLFANIKENNTVEGQIGFDPKVSIFQRILDSQPKANYFPDRRFGSKELTKFLSAVSEGPYDFVKMSKNPATESNIKKFFKIGSELSWPENWWEYPHNAGKVAKQVNDLRDKFLVSRKSGVYVMGGGHLTAIKDIIDRQGVAKGVNDYLWHGSRNEHKVLYPRQAVDTGGAEGSNKNAVYATPNAKFAITMGLTTPGSDFAHFPNDSQGVLFSGNLRKGEMVYLHKVPKDLFIKHNGREWYSKPGVSEVKTIEVVTVPVDKYLNLIRQATPQDWKLRQHYLDKAKTKEQGVAEGIEHNVDDLSDVADWMRTTPDKLKIVVKQEPIEKFMKQIREMYGTYDEFPEDEERTNRILKLLGKGSKPLPMYVEYGDPDLFVMEGRHRMVAFWLAGMKTIPVAYVSIKEQGVAENFADGKNPGRKGLAKRMGVPTKASVSRLRQIAKSSSGEKQRMAHWIANMKSGKKK